MSLVAVYSNVTAFQICCICQGSYKTAMYTWVDAYFLSSLCYFTIYLITYYHNSLQRPSSWASIINFHSLRGPEPATLGAQIQLQQNLISPYQAFLRLMSHKHNVNALPVIRTGNQFRTCWRTQEQELGAYNGQQK